MAGKRARKDMVEVVATDPGFFTESPELDFFKLPKEQESIFSTQEVIYTPMTSLDNDGPVTFCIPASDEYTDLSQTTLELTVKVIKANGSELAHERKTIKTADGKESLETQDVTVPNDFFDYLIRRLTLEINSVTVGSEHNYHSHVNMLKKLLSYSSYAASSNLKDTIVWMPDNGEDYRDAMGEARYKYIAGSRELTLISRLSHDGFTSTKLLPPGNSLKIQIDRSSPEFALVRKEGVNNQYKIKWTDARLNINRVRLVEKMTQDLDRRIKAGSPVYIPFTRTDARSFEIPTGSKHFKAHALFSGILPTKALLVLTNPDAMGYGEYTNNPAIFPAREFGVSQIQFFIDERAVLTRPFRPDWDADQYQREYQALLHVLGYDQSEGYCCIDYDMFAQDYGIFAAKFRGVDGKETGILSVELRFNTATTKPIAGLVIPEFRSCIMIDNHKNVHQSDY